MGSKHRPEPGMSRGGTRAPDLSERRGPFAGELAPGSGSSQESEALRRAKLFRLTLF